MLEEAGGAMDCGNGAKDSGIDVVGFREYDSMHNLVLYLKVCYVVSLETYIKDIVYMITHIMLILP